MTQDAKPKIERTRPSTIESCHVLIDQLFDSVDELAENCQRLQDSLDEMRRLCFGPRRERIDDSDQLKLFEAGSDERSDPDEATDDGSEDEEPRGRQKRRRGRRRFPKEFKRVRVEHGLTEAELPCPCCGKPRAVIGMETSERLDYHPGHYEVIEDVRYKYACEDETCEKHVTTAPKPPQPIEKGAAGPGLLADIIVSKYTDHLPTYRKEEISDRHGWMIPRTTQCGWLRQCAATTTLLVALMAARVLRSRKIHTDDTPVKVLVPGQGKTHQGTFWVYGGDDENPYGVYDFTMRRTRDGPAHFLSGYEGYLQADGYGGYDGIAIESDGRLRLVACGAHIRRKFYAQRLNAPALAYPALAWYRQLYQWEQDWKTCTEQERYALRQEHALPLLAEFHDWLHEVAPGTLPKSKIGEAVSYALNQWDHWKRYCDAGFLTIDNNISERMVKVCAMGRKAWLFLGSENGGATAAILYSLTASAKANHAHPFFYVRDVLNRLPELVHDARLQSHLEAACREAPLTDDQALQFSGCRRPVQFLDILRCHPRSLAERFRKGLMEQELVDALTELLPDRWLVEHPQHRLEINRPTGIPVGLESVLSN